VREGLRDGGIDEGAKRRRDEGEGGL